MKKILETKNLCKSFGAIKVADELNFHVAENEALGIIGPNGAGKTSLFNLITGTIKQDKGNIFYQGESIDHLNVPNRCHQGISRSFQIPQPFGGLSVFENKILSAASFILAFCPIIVGLLPPSSRVVGTRFFAV